MRSLANAYVERAMKLLFSWFVIPFIYTHTQNLSISYVLSKFAEIKYNRGIITSETGK